MIFKESKINVSDNSGAKKAKCIQVLKASKVSGAKPGDFVVMSIRKIKKNKNIIKGQVCRGVFIRGKRNVQRFDGSVIKFSDNATVLLDVKKVPIGSRIIGSAYKELRYKDYPKVLSLVKSII